MKGLSALLVGLVLCLCPVAASAQAPAFWPDIADMERVHNQMNAAKSSASPRRTIMFNAYLDAWAAYADAWTMYSDWKLTHPGGAVPGWLYHADGFLDDGNYWTNESDQEWDAGDIKEMSGNDYMFGSPPNHLDAFWAYLDARDFYGTSEAYSDKAIFNLHDALFFYEKAIDHMSNNP